VVRQLASARAGCLAESFSDFQRKSTIASQLPGGVPHSARAPGHRTEGQFTMTNVDGTAGRRFRTTVRIRAASADELDAALREQWNGQWR
jgi:hypothetical protein